MPVGPIISPAPLFACLTHGTVGVLASSCSGQVLWECWTLRSLHPPSLAVCSGLQTTPVAALALGSGVADLTGTRNWELPQPKLLCSAFPPWPPALSCEVIQDVRWRRRREPCCKCCAEQAGNANVNGREGWLLLHLVSVFWELGKLGKGDRAGVELF